MNPNKISLKIILPLVLIIFILSANMYSQGDIKFEHIWIKKGLLQASINCILQDSKGFIWIGTESGLNRYDGYNCILYTHDVKNPESLSNNWAYSIYEDHLGNLWIGTDDGLNLFDRDKESFRRYYHDPEEPNSLSNNKVYTIFEDKSGSLWIGTENGLNKFNREDETFKRYQFEPENPQSISDNHIRSILEDSSGVLWVGTDNGLNIFNRDGKTWLRIQSDPNDPHSLSHNSINSMCEDSLGRLWIGTDRGLNEFDSRTGKFNQYIHIPGDSKSLSDDWIHVVYQDSLGTIWIGTNEGGLNRFDRAKKEFIHYQNDPHNPYSLSGNRIYSIYEDRSRVMWVGTYGGGLCKFNRETKKFNHFAHDPESPSSLSHSFVRAFLVDHSDTLWVGTDGGGLNRYDQENDRFIHYRHNPIDPRSLSNDRVFSIIEDSSGVFWIGTYGGGLNKFDPKSGKFTSYRHSPSDPNSISNDRIRIIYEGQPGILWIGTDGGGLNKFEIGKGTFIHYRHDSDNPNSISNDRIFSILKSSTGDMWIATFGGGLNKFDPEKGQFSPYRFDPDDPNSLRNDYLIMIHEDRSGMLWMGSNGAGLIKFDPQKEKFSYYTEDEGLASNVVYGIVEDDEGYIWISTHNGLSKFNPKTEIFRNYDVNDGLQDNEFNGGSCYKSAQGELFFGGINGFNRFYPEMIKDNPHVPPVVITGFQLFNKPVPLGEREDGRSIIEKSITETEEIRLSYRDRVFSFEFAALHYASPERNKYAYMMEGFEKDWNYVGNRRFVTYTNLPPGDYVFRVKGSNNDGIWNEEGTSLKIIITPPAWQTWWFRILGLTAIILLFFVGHLLRTHSIRERSKQLEKKVEERTAELRISNRQLQKEIAERKQAERKLETEKAYLDQLFESAQEGIVMTDARGQVIRVNDEFSKIFGYTPEEVQGKHIDELVVPDRDHNKGVSITKRVAEREHVAFEAKRQRKDGALIDVSALASAIIVNDEVVAAYAIYRDITEQKRDKERILKQNDVVRAINRVFRETLICETEEEVAEACLGVAEELTGSQFGFIGELNEQGRFDTIAQSDTGWKACRIPKSDAVRLIRDMEIRGIWGKVLKEQQSLIVNDPSSHPDSVGTPEGHPQIKNFLGIPLMRGGKAIGMIGLANKEHGYDLEDKQAIEALSTAFVESLMRKRAEEAIKKRKSQLELVHRIQSEIPMNTDIETILKSAAESIGRTFGYNKVSVNRFDRDREELVYTVGWNKSGTPTPRGHRQKIGEGLIGKAAQLKRTIVANDVSKEPSYVVYYQKKTKSELCIPLLVEDRLLGVLDIQDIKKNAFTEDDISILQSVANYISYVIEEKEKEENLKRRAMHAALISKVGQRVSIELKLESLLSEIVTAICEAFNYYGVTLLLLDEKTQCLTLQATAGGYAEIFSKGLKVEMEEGMIGYAAASGSTQISNDVSKDPHYVRKAGEKTKSELSVPIKSGEKVIGVLDIQSDELNAFDETDVSAMETLSTQIAAAIENARLYDQAQREINQRRKTEKELKQTLAELERSNRELEQFAYMASHDLQEPLRMISSYTQLLAQRYKDKLDADANDFIVYAVDGAMRMQTLINDLLSYSRVSTRGKPFEPADCENALEKVFANLKVALDESGAVITHDPLPIVVADSSQLIQLFQNLIENAIKFRSESTPRIHISAERKRNEWIFSVSDNGIGIDPQYKERVFIICQRLHSRERYPGTGIGLAICKKIVERHGGRIWVESKIGKGSTFYFTIPEKRRSRNDSSRNGQAY